MQGIFRTNTWLRHFLLILFTACLYFLLARISLFLQFESSNATPVWPPAGFAFAMVIIWGIQVSPGILFGAFAANFLVFISNQTVDYPTAALLSLFIAAGNTGEALVGNYLLKHFIPKFSLDTFLDKVDHILRFSMIGALMCFAGSTIGSMTVYFAGIVDNSQVSTVWLTWWLGDLSGVLLITSFILILLKYFRNNLHLPESLIPETVVFYLIVFVTSEIIFNGWLFSNPFFNWAYWIIPILVWAALRLSQRELITTLVIYSLIAVWGTVHGRGPFSILSLNEGLLALQAFITIMVITKLTLNASVSERRETEKKLRKTGDELEVRVKQRTAQLEERNQLVETVLNSSFDSIIVLDKEMRCISINRVAKNQLKLPYPENVIGKKLTEIPAFLLPDEIMDDIKAALKGDAVHRDKYASPVSDKYFEVDYIPLRNFSGVYAMMIVGHDITQRIHSEHQIREQKAFAEMLIESSPYMIMAYDRSLQITAWNKKSEEYTGVSKTEAIGMNLFDLFPQYNNAQWDNMIKDVFNNGQSFHFSKIPFLFKPGWGESFVTPLYNSYDEIVGVLSITHDVTELVNATTALEERNKDLQKTNEELSSFAYVASHDLQEPLRKIQIFSKRIIESEMDVLSETGKDYFDRMKNAAERMQHLIEDLLAYSRTGSMTRKFETFHLSEIIEEVKEHLHDEIILKNATIVAEDLCECTVIRFQFRQLLHNLFSNSLKFSSPDRLPVITVTSNIEEGYKLDQPLLEPDKKYCHIVITDNGIGFNPEFSEQIFGLFQRLHGKSEFPGTGIGLSICKKIIENHHGVITADGNPGKGARFDIYIPNE